jgi:hypothetical protein
MPGPLNTDYFSSLTAQVNQCTSCAELQAVATEAMGALNAQLTEITALEAAFAAIQSLLTPPGANLSEIVTWITTLINDYLGPQLAAYAKYTAQVAALTAEIATLTAAINSAAAKFADCSITI